jgi:hypothetical protein
MSAAIPPPALLADLVAFLNAARADPLNKGEVNQVAYRLLVSFLQALLDLLDVAPSDLSGRQLAFQLVRCLPVKDYRKENVSDLASCLLRCESPGITWNDPARPVAALEQRCADLFTLVHSSLSEFSGEANQRRRRLRLPVEARESVPSREQRPANGPTEGNALVWQRRSYPFSLLQWRLLRALWADSGEFPIREDEEIRSKVWTERPASSEELSSLQVRTNRKLLEYGLPFQIVRPRPLYLQLRKQRRAPTRA